MTVLNSQKLRGLTWAVLILYSAAVIYWMFVGFGREARMNGAWQYNLVPLRTIQLFFDLENGLSLRSRLVNLLGNVAVFVPFGFLLPFLNKKLHSLTGITLFMAFFILVLESLQMLLHVGSFDIDDLILNLLGVWTGCILLRLSRRVMK